MIFDFLLVLLVLALVVYISYLRGKQDARKVSPEMIETVSMIVLDKTKDPMPGVNWQANRHWTVNDVREKVRVALTVALENHL